MLVDGAGNLFVSEGNFRSGHIFKFTPVGKKSTFAAFGSWFGMGFDRAGNLFAGDWDSGSIFKFAPDGSRSPFVTGVLAPNGPVFDRSDNLFAVDGSRHWIFKFTPDGAKSTFAAGIVGVNSLVCDPSGNLLVSVAPNDGSHAILKFTPEGVESTLASGLNSNALVFDGAGDLFVADGRSIFKIAPDGTRSKFAVVDESWISPDKKWEYAGPDDGGPKIVKAGTSEMARDLSDVCDIGSCGEGAAVIWAPDSKRFALNWGSGRSHTIALYQLRGDKWVELRSPEDETSKRIQRAQSVQLRKEHLPKNASRHHIGDADEVRKWADANTAILYAYSDMVVIETRISAHFLFTLKFDTEGNWKIVKTHQMSDKEVEKEDAGEMFLARHKQLVRRRSLGMRVFATRIVTLMKFITRCAPASPRRSAIG